MAAHRLTSARNQVSCYTSNFGIVCDPNGADVIVGYSPDLASATGTVSLGKAQRSRKPTHTWVPSVDSLVFVGWIVARHRIIVVVVYVSTAAWILWAETVRINMSRWENEKSEV
jgi:hypothetical protein